MIKRPNKTRDTVRVMNTQNMQENFEEQFENIYDYLDEQEKASLIDKVYPVGSIYMNVTEINPDEILGGEWERLENMFLLGASDTYKAGTTGGTTKHKHTLNTKLASNYGAGNGSAYTAGSIVWNGSNAISESEHMPPYLSVYMWKRIK